MKVLVADKFEASGLDGLRAAGCDVVYEPGLKDDALAAAIGTTAADVLVVRSTKVTAAMLDAGRLSLIVRAGAGYNTIDVDAASTRGIYVSNCPGKNAIAVAELTLALILVARSPRPRQRRRAAGRLVEQAGVLEGARAARGDARDPRHRQHRPGSDQARRRLRPPVVVWSRRFDGLDRPMSDAEAAALGLDEAARQVPIDRCAESGGRGRAR